MGYRSVRISDVEPIAAAGDTLRWHPLRFTLGIRAFGVNAYTAPRAGDDVVEEHQEGDPDSGHEELYVVLTGSARFTIDGEQFDAPAGTCVFIPDPESNRYAVAIEDDTSVLAVGGQPGAPFEVSGWEARFRAQPYMDAGDFERAVEILADGVRDSPGEPGLNYNLACAEARLGRLDDAEAHLRTALAGDPRVREWADGDADLDPLRDRPGFPL
jgi:hypothetical protein